jgi:hypothetical protein
MKPNLIKPDDDPERPIAYEPGTGPAYDQDPRIEPQRIPPEKFPLNPTIDANPQGKRNADSPRERRDSAIERGERGVGGTAFLLVLLAIVALAAIGYLAFDWGQRSSQVATNNQSATQTVQPKTVDQNQPANALPKPDNGTGTTSLPAQPVKPEQPPNGTSTIQP